MDIKVENEHINLICHGCLTTERKLRCIRDEFRKIFHFLRNDDKADVQSREVQLCWECVGFLKKLKMFQARIRKAELILVTCLQNYHYEDEYTNPPCLSSLKNTHIYTCEYYDEEKLLHEVANNDDIELKDEEGRIEIELTADIKVECNDNIKEECCNSNNKECSDNINKQYNYNSHNDSDYYDTELKIEKEDNIKSSSVENEINKKTYENIPIAEKSSNDNNSDYIETEFKINKKDGSREESSRVNKKNESIWNKYKKFATITKRKDIVEKKYFQYTESVCLSQKEYENVLTRDIKYYGRKNQMKFNCNRCQLVYLTNLDLLRHISFRHNEQATFPYKCAACDTMITSLKHLDEHWTETHTKMLKCTLCSKVFRTMPDIKRHMYKQHTKNYGCKQCGLEFGMLSEFKKHYKDMHKKGICDYCNKSFSNKKFLLSHIRGEHIPEYCKLCDRNFKNLRTLKGHNTITHPELTAGETRKELSYCVECDKQYPSVYKYQRHLIESPRHTPQKKIRVPCPECGKEFAKTSFRNNHYRLFHLKVTKNHCKECDKYFANSYGLRRHIERIHEKIAPLKDKYCDICGQGFASNNILQNHRRTHTGERPFKCKYCPAAFGQKTAMTSHQKSQHKNLDLMS